MKTDSFEAEAITGDLEVEERLRVLKLKMVVRCGLSYLCLKLMTRYSKLMVI